MHVLNDLVNTALAHVDKWMRFNKLSFNYSVLTRSMKFLCSPTEVTSFNVHNIIAGNDMCEVFGRVNGQ